MSDWQGTDIVGLARQWNAEHVIVRLYLPEEGSQRVQHTRDQLENGKGRVSRGGYGWAYQSLNAERSVYNALDVAASVGFTPPVLWWDCELEELDGRVLDYGPTPAQLWTLCNVSAAHGVRAGVYSAPFWWDHYTMQGSTAFRGVPFWKADYNPHRSIFDVPLFAGVESLAGWQYTGSQGQDRSWLWNDVCGL